MVALAAKYRVRKVSQLSTVASPLLDGTMVDVECLNTRGDGLGGSYVWDEDSTATEDGFDVIGDAAEGRWLRIAYPADAVGTAILTSALPAGVDGQILYANGRDAIGDGAHGMLYFDLESEATPDNATVWQVDALPGRWIRDVTGDVNAKWFGATGDGVTDDLAAIQAAIALARSLSVFCYLPAGNYRISARINAAGPGNLVKLLGDGWRTEVQDDYGGAQWIAADAVTGTVIMPDAGSHGVEMTGSWPRLHIQDLAILGRGTGTARSGVYAGSGTSNNPFTSDNVAIFNFARGVTFKTVATAKGHHRLAVRGCTDGLYFEDNCSDVTFLSCEVQNFTRGVNLLSAGGMHFYGLLIQTGATAVSIAPFIEGGVNNIYFNNGWIENLTVANVAVDASLGKPQYIEFSGIRGSAALAGSGLPGPCAIVGNHWAFRGCNLFWSATLTNAQYCEIDTATKFNSIVTGADCASISVGTRYRRTVITSSPFTIDNMDTEINLFLQSSVTINPPTFKPDGFRFRVVMKQDNTGGRNVTWNGFYFFSAAYSNTGNTGDKYWSGEFVVAGGNFFCLSNTGWVDAL